MSLTPTWRILLRARLHEVPDDADLAARWQALLSAQQWPASTPITGRGWDAVLTGPPVALARDGAEITIGAVHDLVDGLGLLRILDALVDGGVRTDARGVADRPTASGTTSSRLREVLRDPPARLSPGPDAVATAGEVIVEADAPGHHGTAALVHAVARVAAVRTGGRRQVAVAVGAGRPTSDGPIHDDSALLRLTGVEGLDAEAVAAALRTAPIQPPPAAGAGVAAEALTRVALRVLGPRLGSTFLVSHLGRVGAPAASDLRFSPATGSGGLALGALTLDDVTRLTLRASGPRHGWDAARLDGVLAAIVAELRA
ncbi:hypothetical protein GCM10022215_13320 [Nocardioides fonticola]|uniref:Uncharacterized protein n=1 Tax=Nocardioides fonticola TaxID=450363 RepID=A0ABP7XGD4_9ACTN